MALHDVVPRFLVGAGHSVGEALQGVGEVRKMLTNVDKLRISDAIKIVESQTAAEIFCVITRHSSEYKLIPLAWAASVSLLTPLPLIYITNLSAEIIYCIQLLVFLLAAVVLSNSRIRFHIVPTRAKHDRSHAEAARQFVVQGMSKTEHRTGVLIFVSVAERYAEIVADAGIDGKVTPVVWSNAIESLVSAIKIGRPADGFVTAIEQCGAVLIDKYPLGTLKRNELPDKIFEI
jgi:putative membrane protein